MKPTSDVNLDLLRAERIGFGEAVLSDGKAVEQLDRVLHEADRADHPMLLTRLDRDKYEQLSPIFRASMDYDEFSRTAYFGAPAPVDPRRRVAVVTAGTSDAPVALEAARTLQFNGIHAEVIQDVGVAGLWRLQARAEEIATHRVVIAIAGMDAALPTVLAGLVGGLIVAVPTSTGYGIAEGGMTALRSLLASCGPGLVVVNIDNGYGAACAAMRALGPTTAAAEADGPSSTVNGSVPA